MKKPIIALTMNAVCAHEEKRPSTFGSHYLNFAYAEAITRAGGIPIALPYGPTENIGQILECVQGAVITGGKDVDPAIYGQEPHEDCGLFISEKSLWEKRLVLELDERDLPLLGICLGMQVVNVARGGTLCQDLPSLKPSEINHPYPMEERQKECHDVFIEKGSRLATLCGEGRFPVNSLHHQGVEKLGKGLEVVAHSKDGLVEALEDDNRSFLIAVQWHPEDLQHLAPHQALFDALIEACRAR